MTEADRFEQLMESNPASAMKYVKEFEETTFWKYVHAFGKQTLRDLLQQLYDCDKENIDRIRGRIDELGTFLAIPESAIDQLKDQMALQKEAAKIEAARTPEKEDDWLKPMKINRA